MTREEAIEAVMTRHAKLSFSLTGEDLREIAESDVDIWVALGMLKLDEPMREPSTGQLGRTRQFMKDFHLGSYSPGQLEQALNATGLKIVEK
jgi:hypothetical protein